MATKGYTDADEADLKKISQGPLKSMMAQQRQYGTASKLLRGDTSAGDAPTGTGAVQKATDDLKNRKNSLDSQLDSDMYKKRGGFIKKPAVKTPVKKVVAKKRGR